MSQQPASSRNQPDHRHQPTPDDHRPHAPDDRRSHLQIWAPGPRTTTHQPHGAERHCRRCTPLRAAPAHTPPDLSSHHLHHCAWHCPSPANPTTHLGPRSSPPRLKASPTPPGSPRSTSMCSGQNISAPLHTQPWPPEPLARSDEVEQRGSTSKSRAEGRAPRRRRPWKHGWLSQAVARAKSRGREGGG